jgi:hypothetical protein
MNESAEVTMAGRKSMGEDAEVFATAEDLAEGRTHSAMNFGHDLFCN